MKQARTGVIRLENRGRLSPVDWEHAALEAIAEQGIGAVAIEPLARRLGVTKGSFYWHFPTREALLKAALQRWERMDEEEFRGVEPIRDPRERLRVLFRRTSREMQSHVVYSALLRALDHASVQPVMSRVSQKRIDFLNVAYRPLGLERSAASYRARLAYAAYAGFPQLSLQLGLPRLSHAVFDGYIDHAISTLIPA
ncbi:helix-turn-helix domain-containing protein [Tahibacter sp.]|uniref:TetR/AcrR family transcriptional regulator n=1 Tax=Tahibacter sp. TaxID=2056211 RepID=UPI0028C4FFEF|nr:helix-turn-helix domain-containing protein [Tahibacter sp.]